MRIASWLFVACAALAVVSVFLPSLQVEVHGFTGKRTSVSLYKAVHDRQLARALFGRYRRSAGRSWGEAATAVLVPRMGKHKVHLDDAQDAMETLDELDDDDVRHAGQALAVAVWTLLGACALMAMLVTAELVGTTSRARRMWGAAALSVLVALLAIGALLGCREAAWQANDELGTHNVVLGIGAYLLPVMACGALVAITSAIVLQRRARRAQRMQRASPASPPPPAVRAP